MYVYAYMHACVYASALQPFSTSYSRAEKKTNRKVCLKMLHARLMDGNGNGSLGLGFKEGETSSKGVVPENSINIFGGPQLCNFFMIMTTGSANL